MMPRHACVAHGLVAVLAGAGLVSVAVEAASAQTITEFSIPTLNAYADRITPGPDGNLWFTEGIGGRIGRITPTGAIVEFGTGAGQLMGIATGSEGNLWFTEYFGNKLWRMTPAGVAQAWPVPTSASGPRGIAAGQDGNLWFTEVTGGKIGHMNAAVPEYLHEFTVPGGMPWWITAGPDGNLWFTAGSNKVGRITTSGVITMFTVPTSNGRPWAITAGPDGNLWFTESNASKIGRITTSGVITEFTIPTASSNPQGITAGPDGALWFTEMNANKIGRITVAGTIIEIPIPTAASYPSGMTSTSNYVWFTESGGNKIGRIMVRPQAVWHGWFAVDTLETPMVGDFNGDGKTDVITLTRQNPLAVGDVYVALSNGTDQFVDKNGTSGSSDKWNDWFAITTDETVVIGDYDGDGKDDIATWLGSTTRQVYVARSLGSAMEPSTVWVDSIGFDPSDVILSGDVNGDVKADLVCFARRQGKVYVALSDGTKFAPPALWHGFFAVSTYERPRVADVNGDGKADIITFATDSPTAFGDVYVARSDGSQFVDQNGTPGSSTKWHDWFAIRPTEQVRVGDLNGDGADDFFTFLPPPFGQAYTVLSMRDHMADNLLWREVVVPAATDIPFVGDVNGDGKADVIVFAQGEGKVYVSLAQ